MNLNQSIFCLLALSVAEIGNVTAAAKTELETPLTAQGRMLETHYADMLAGLRAEIAGSVPKIAEPERAVFLKAYAAEAEAKSAMETAMKATEQAGVAKNVQAKELTAKASQNAEASFAQAQANTVASAKPILAELALTPGRNILRFTLNTPNCGLTIKQFTLTPVR